MTDDIIDRLAGLGESMTTLKLIGDLQDRIEAQAAEIERLREALRRGHFIHLTKEEVDDAKAKGIPLRDYAIAKRKTALGETLHVAKTCKENGESFT
jgi:hypothetical protein